MGWLGTKMQTALSYVWLVGDGEAGGVAGDSPVCECAAGGAGPCTVRAPPGREPCMFVEIADGEGWGKGSRKRRARTIGAESLEVTSSVELRTHPVMTTTAAAAMGRKKPGKGDRAAEECDSGAGVAGGGGRGETAVAGGGVWSALRAAVVERSLPLSVDVPVYFARLVVGAALVFLAQPLSESRVFHYLLSALLGGVVGAAGLLLRALSNPKRVFLRYCFLFCFVPAAGQTGGRINEVEVLFLMPYTAVKCCGGWRRPFARLFICPNRL